MIPLYIFDIDGTLANLEHRLHFITRGPLPFNPDWDAFHAHVGDDDPIMSVIMTLQSLFDAGADIWFFTGRMESCREETIRWLKWNVISDVKVLEMRKTGDYRPDTIVKEEMLDNMLYVDRDRLIAIFDDRQSVVDMWRRRGITCFQCADGDF